MNHELLPTGQIVNTHGLRGHVKVMPWADDPGDLLDFSRFFIDNQEYAVQSASLQKGMVLLKLKGVESIDDAARLRQKELCIAREDVELEDGVVFVADLIGLPVLADGVEIGRITEVMTLPGNDVYVVRGEKEYLIPAVTEYVEPLNTADGCVKVHLIEGMQTDAD